MEKKLKELEDKLLDTDVEYMVTGNMKYKVLSDQLQKEINDLISNNQNEK